VDENGNFSLHYADKDYGMGYLKSEEDKPFILILGGEDITLKGEAFSMPQSIEILKGEDNQLFGRYASEHPRREQALSAWDYLYRIYSQDSLFSIHAKPVEAIGQEKQRIKAEDQAFLDGLDQQSYVSWFLPVRKLVSSVSTIAQYRTEEIPGAIDAFRQLDYTDRRMYKSGLLRDALDAHIWLIENSGRSLDSVFIGMNISIDHMIDNLLADEEKLNEITDYLFNLLEQRSLFAASEYLALKVLNEVSCTIDASLASKLESYRAMKKGNTAPEIIIQGDVLAPGYAPQEIPDNLNQITTEYTLLVFGASWCPNCSAELREIAGKYSTWKLQGVEVVFVSLDTEKSAFEAYAKDFPFISFTDYQKWETQAAKDYHVFATPTMFLLNSNRKIILRPNSARHMDAWVEWVLEQGNR
jgi:peroxiredoxin